MKTRLGINNCFAVKRWPEPDEWTAILSAELGLDLVQHTLDLTDMQASDTDLQDGAADIRRELKRSGVELDSLFTGLAAYSHSLMLAPHPRTRRNGVEYWSRAIHIAAWLGTGCFGGHVGSLSRPDTDDPARRGIRWAELSERLEELCRQARTLGLATLLVENMACDREPSRMQDVVSLLRAGDEQRAAISLCLDVGHQCVPGTHGDERDPYVWLRALGRDARVVHVQQSDADADHHWPFTAEYNRRGRIEAPRVLEALLESQADEATLILEVIPAFEASDRLVLEQLRESVDYWVQALDDAGAERSTPTVP